MDKQVLNPAANLNNVEMPSTQNVTNQSADRVCIPANSVERKNAKKKEIDRKKVNSRKERYENKITGEKTEYNTSPMIVCGDANNPEYKILSGKIIKRKATTEDQSENGIKQEKDDGISAENRNLKEKNDTTTKPNRKTARKEKSDQKIEVDPNTTDGNTGRNVKENNNSSAKQSASKPIVQSEASDDEEKDLVLSDKDMDLYVLGSLMLPKEVLKVCIQNIKSPSGASLDEIYEQIKTATQVKLDYIKNLIDEFLKKCVESRLLHEYTSHRYKI